MKGAPNTPTGRLTEHIMQTISARVSTDFDAAHYNAIWNAVAAALRTAEDVNVQVVENNDWAFMAKVTALPWPKRRAFYKAAMALAEAETTD